MFTFLVCVVKTLRNYLLDYPVVTYALTQSSTLPIEETTYTNTLSPAFWSPTELRDVQNERCLECAALAEDL